VIHVSRKSVSPDEPGNFFAEASTLGWKPGFFPKELMLGRTHMLLARQDLNSAIYGSCGCRRINLIVWND